MFEYLQTESGLIEGRWQLMFTTRPGTASPIQVLYTHIVAFVNFVYLTEIRLVV